MGLFRFILEFSFVAPSCGSGKNKGAEGWYCGIPWLKILLLKHNLLSKITSAESTQLWLAHK